MSATYSNRFTVERMGPQVIRIVFSDERAKIGEGFPAAIATVGEIVLTTDNARELGKLLERFSQ